MYGKIRKITKTNGTIIRYGYDASGNRISKIVTTTTPTIAGDSTYYVRDASGNVMSVCNKKSAANLLQTELHMYGSSRLGVCNVSVDVQNCPYVLPAAITIFTRGNKFFELSNHLGNVLATITDKKIQHSTDGTLVDYYGPDVSSATDYYPFGMQMSGRSGHAVSSGGGNPGGANSMIANLLVNSRPGNTPAVYESTNSIEFNPGFASGTGDVFEAHIVGVVSGGSSGGAGTWGSSGSGYRYGFKGKEKNSELNESDYDFGARMYDARIGRFKSIDPEKVLLVSISHYSFALNSPIRTIDANGEFPILINGNTSSDDERGGSSYWNESNLSTISVKLGGFDGIKNRKLGYFQGAGHLNGHYSQSGSTSSKFWGDFLMVDGNRGIRSGKSMWPNNRNGAGVVQAKADAASVWAKLKLSMNKDGQITEKIEIISHSRGGSFANGYVEQLKVEIDKLATKDKIGFAYDKGSVIDLVVHLAPHQSNYIDVSKSKTATVTVSNYSDLLSGNDATGDVIDIYRVQEKSSTIAHGNVLYNAALGAILDAFLEGGKTNLKENLKAEFKKLDDTHPETFKTSIK